MGLIYHVQKHSQNFLNIQNYTLALNSIKKILSVVVNIEKNMAYVATIYPVNKKKIDKLKQKAANNVIIT